MHKLSEASVASMTIYVNGEQVQVAPSTILAAALLNLGVACRISESGEPRTALCGMGTCQGRICGPALNALFGWRNTSVRSPIFPIPLAALCSEPLRTEEIKTTDLQENHR